ncbi:Uncharacterised protein [Escherichia coli]|uniref:Uncharacterized protein n=1 Tax=Escherichia coli TaxID=562 RepID=A0A376TM53_ECOLX|nr:Uncharacterised protein [Escherichia coli]
MVNQQIAIYVGQRLLIKDLSFFLLSSESVDVRLDHSGRAYTIPTRVLAISRGSFPVDLKPNRINILLIPESMPVFIITNDNFFYMKT